MLARSDDAGPTMWRCGTLLAAAGLAACSNTAYLTQNYDGVPSHKIAGNVSV
jgi:hypothetical protein